MSFDQLRNCSPHSLPVQRILPTILSLLLLACVANAQRDTDGSTPLGMSRGTPAGSYTLGGFDNVNLFNGHLNFGIPLLSMSGRGAVGYKMTLPLEQTWTIFKQTNEITHNVTYHPEANWWTGLKPGYGAGVMLARKGGRGSVPCGQPSGLYRYSQTLTRVTFTAGDGTEFEMA